MKLNKKIKILITAGPTREYIDPVRYISNDSSGKLGYLLAENIAKDKNTEVLLVSGPVSLPEPRYVKTVKVVSALEMYAAVKKAASRADILVFCAAVSDYRPVKTALSKLKKKNKPLSLKLIPNPDILLETSRMIDKNKTVLAGFALESNNLKRNAIGKLRSKSLDIVIANKVSTIGSEYIDGFIIIKGLKTTAIRHSAKKVFAGKLWNVLRRTYMLKTGRDK